MSNVDDEDDKGKSNQSVNNDWMKSLKKRCNTRNAGLIIRNDPRYKNIFYFNELTGICEIRKKGKLGDLTDRDLVYCEEYIQETYSIPIAGDTIFKMVTTIAAEQPYHPIKDEWSSYVWDGVPRVDDWPIVYLGCEDSLYAREIGLRSLLKMVGKVFKPGMQDDYMTILEGEQGLGKSQFLQALAGKPEYFTNSLHTDVNSVDGSLGLKGVLIVEIAEMVHHSRREDSEFKSFLSKSVDKYRPPYGRLHVRVPRQCTIWGTTNHSEYLKDETGGRRYWGLWCTEIKLEKFKRDRKQIIAEAVQRFRDGELTYPSKEFENTYIKPQQKKRMEFDEWQNVIIDQIKKGNNSVTFTKITIAEIYQCLLGRGFTNLPSKIEEMRIAKILRTNECKKDRSNKSRWWNIQPLVDAAEELKKHERANNQRD